MLYAAQSLNDDIQHDIHQLQGLVDRVDSSDEFLPLRDEDVADQDTARRMVNFIGLIDPIVDRLKQDGIADTEGLNPTNSAYHYGRYFRMYDRFPLLLVIDLKLWLNYGVSPLRLGSWIKEVKMENLEKARGAFPNDVGPSTYRYFPIRLKPGVEKNRVIDHAVEKIKQIVDHCREPAPQDSPSGN